MVIVPHHAAAVKANTSEVAPKWASGSTWSGWVFTESAGLEFLCLGDYLAPPRQVGGGGGGVAPRGALGRHPSADSRRWRPAGGPVAGAQSAKVIANQVGCNTPHVTCVLFHGPWASAAR
jgi:hypothetical protein